MELLDALMIFGLVIGLGAVTVIDLLGILGQKSPYWTLATLRSHRVTKPLIWVGISACTLSALLSQKWWLFAWILPLVLNGFWLSFRLSPYLLGMEDRKEKLVPQQFQTQIKVRFIISFLLWWSLFATQTCLWTLPQVSPQHCQTTFNHPI